MSNNLLKIASAFSALIIVLCGCGKIGSNSGFIKPEHYASAVTISINPEIRLFLDPTNEIIETQYLNNDASDAYSPLKLNGMSLEKGLDAIIETAIQKQYLQKNKDITVDVEEIKDDIVSADAILITVKSAVKDTLSRNKFKAGLITKISGETKENLSVSSVSSHISSDSSSSSKSSSSTDSSSSSSVASSSVVSSSSIVSSSTSSVSSDTSSVSSETSSSEPSSSSSDVSSSAVSE